MEVKIEVSARHVHITYELFVKLFGDVKPKIFKELSQPGEFALEQSLNIKTDKGMINNVRLLYPFRDYVQVEISVTDAYALGLTPPVRDSDELDMAGTCGVTLLGPLGCETLIKGVIVPWRHLHMNQLDSLEWNINDGQIVKVNIDNNPRSLVFENVLVRVSPSFKTTMHIDTDEGNAAGIKGAGIGNIII